MLEHICFGLWTSLFCSLEQLDTTPPFWLISSIAFYSLSNRATILRIDNDIPVWYQLHCAILELIWTPIYSFDNWAPFYYIVVDEDEEDDIDNSSAGKRRRNTRSVNTRKPAGNKFAYNFYLFHLFIVFSCIPVNYFHVSSFQGFCSCLFCGTETLFNIRVSQRTPVSGALVR